MEENITEDYKTVAAISPMVDLWMEPIRQKFAELSRISPRQSIIDICCGTGRQAEIYSQRGARAYGLDASRHMISEANKKAKATLTFILGDATAIQCPDSMFNYSSTSLALHEVDNDVRDKFISEMRRVTKPDGYLMFLDYGAPNSGMSSILLSHFYTGVEMMCGRSHYRNYKIWARNGGIENYIRSKGLTIEEKLGAHSGNILLLKVRNEKGDSAATALKATFTHI